MLLNNQIQIDLPEGFRRLSEQELRDRNANMSDEGVVLRHDERQVLIQMMWKKIPFFGRGVTLEKMVENTAETHRRLVPSFRNQVACRTTIAGQDACGFRYEYLANDVKYMTVYYLIRTEKMTYSFSLSCRKETGEEDERIFNELLATAAMV